MFCNLFKLRSRFNHTLQKDLLDYGDMLKPISNCNVINLLESLGQAAKYAKTGNDQITRYLVVLQIFAEININEIKELFHDNQKDIIDMETEIIYGMVRVDYLEVYTRHYYLIPKSNKKKLTSEVIEKYFSDNFQIGYLLNKVKYLEGKLVELEGKIVELEYAPCSVFLESQKHFEESIPTNNSKVIEEPKPNEYLLNKIHQLEQSNKDMQEKIVALERSPIPIEESHQNNY